MRVVSGLFQSEHSVVVSDTAGWHSNSVEVSAADLAEEGDDDHGAAWAPTVINAFGKNVFFFETWRSTSEKRW